MTELELYKKHVISWVFVLANKYLKDERFGKILADFKFALYEDELEAARMHWKEMK